MTDWQPIETAPSGWVVVSMRDVHRPREWMARRISVMCGPKRRQVRREFWLAKDDGLICAPTHWRPSPQQER